MNLHNIRMVINNTLDNPYVLSNDNMRTLIYIHDHNITGTFSGHVTTQSGFISAYNKYILEELGFVVDIPEENVLAITYSLTPTQASVYEGQSAQIRTNGVSESALRWSIQNITVSGTSAANADLAYSRIHISDTGLFSVDLPLENLSWTARVTIATCPKYIDENNALLVQRNTVTTVIVATAIAITDVKIELENPFIGQGDSTTIIISNIPSGNTKSTLPSILTASCITGQLLGTTTYIAPQDSTYDTITAGLLIGDAYVQGSYSFQMSLSVVTPTSNLILWNALLQCYPDMFGDEGRTDIKSLELALITDVALLFKILRESTEPFSFEEFRYFNGINALPEDSALGSGCMAGSKITRIHFPDSISIVSGISSTSSSSGTVTNYVKIGSFADCINLVYVNFGNGVKTVSGGTFLSNGWRSYWSAGAFSRCTNLAEVIFGNVTTISGNLSPMLGLKDYSYGGAFAGCTKLTSIVLTNVTTVTGGLNFNYDTLVYAGAFAGCSGLTTVMAPKLTLLSGASYPAGGSGASSYGGAFSGCTVLETFIAPLLTTLDGIATDTRLVKAGPLAESKVDVSGLTSLSSLGWYALSYINIPILNLANTKIKSIPSTTEIFRHTTATKIIFPKGNITIPYSNNPGSNNWLYESSVDTLDFSNSIVTSIGGYFMYNKPSSLIHLAFPQSTVVALSYGTYLYTYGILYVFVPDGLVDTYKAASGWTDYITAGGQILPLTLLSEYGWDA